MTDSPASRVAVYFDFDNIVISRYDQVNGRNSYQRDRSRDDGAGEFTDKLKRATVDVGAIVDFASSFGTLVLTRAYADWSSDVNANYRDSWSVAPSIWCSCSPPPRTARTGPTSASPSTRSRTCSGSPT